MRYFIILLFLGLNIVVLAHEGHYKDQNNVASIYVDEKVKLTAEEGQPLTWMQWIGTFHLIFLHFPIVLINMLFISESLLVITKQFHFEFTSRFLLISNAIIAPPTALLGYIYSYFSVYSGLTSTFFYLHMWLGFSTAALSCLLVFMRRNGKSTLYYCNLILLLVIVNAASFFGGGMTFGPYHMNPP